MTVNVDNISGDIMLKMNTKPDNFQAGLDLKQAIKDAGFSWKGYGDTGRWQGKNSCAQNFLEKVFKVRIKNACKNVTFYDLNGKCLGAKIDEFVQSAMSYDPDTLDDDFSNMGSTSTVPPATADAGSTPDKRARHS